MTPFPDICTCTSRKISVESYPCVIIVVVYVAVWKWEALWVRDLGGAVGLLVSTADIAQDLYLRLLVIAIISQVPLTSSSQEHGSM